MLNLLRTRWLQPIEALSLLHLPFLQLSSKVLKRQLPISFQNPMLRLHALCVNLVTRLWRSVEADAVTGSWDQVWLHLMDQGKFWEPAHSFAYLLF